MSWNSAFRPTLIAMKSGVTYYEVPAEYNSASEYRHTGVMIAQS
jgi:hypothetical protein